jgi:ribonuclease III
MKKLPEFNDSSLLQCALTHRSYVNENPEEGRHNERLEFLGDAILTFLSAEYLYDHPHLPEMAEDEMTRRRAALVDEKQLARFASEIGLSFHMRLGRGAMQEGGFHNPNLLSSTLEAFIGAYYLDKRVSEKENAIVSVRTFVAKLFNSVPETVVAIRSATDSKNQLQHWAQLPQNASLPEYVVVQEVGASHAKEFTIAVSVNGEQLGQGVGKSKKNAEKQAAENALLYLKEQGRL